MYHLCFEALSAKAEANNARTCDCQFELNCSYVFFRSCQNKYFAYPTTEHPSKKPISIFLLLFAKKMCGISPIELKAIPTFWETGTETIRTFNISNELCKIVRRFLVQGISSNKKWAVVARTALHKQNIRIYVKLEINICMFILRKWQNKSRIWRHQIFAYPLCAFANLFSYRIWVAKLFFLSRSCWRPIKIRAS